MDRKIELILSEKAFNILRRDSTIDNLLSAGEGKGPVDFTVSKIVTAIDNGESTVSVRVRGEDV